MLATEACGKCFLATVLGAGIFVCVDLENVGPVQANALELQFDPKTDSFSQKRSVKSQVGDPDGWLTLKLDGTVWDMDAPGVAPSYDPQMFNSASLMAQPAPLEWNQPSAEKSTVVDTRTTLGVLNDRVRLTSRQAVSNYIIPGTNTAYLTPSELEADNAASSQRVDTTVWKTGSTELSLFAEYNRVGANFQAPTFAIKPQDPFWTANSTSTRFGGALQHGLITLTLEQRAQQSLALGNAPTKVENQVGMTVGFDELWGRNSWISEGISWAIPTSAYVTVGQGSVSAAPAQGVNGDTMSDVSAGFLWNRNKVFAHLGYWRSDYLSQLYPWQGLGIDGSVGYHEGWWGIDLFFDVYRSVTSYPTVIQPIASEQQGTTQRSEAMFGGLAFSGRF